MIDMKVLMVNYEFPPIGGGAGHAHQCLLQEYAQEENLEIDVLTSAPQSDTKLEEFSSQILVHKLGIRKKDLHYWRKSEVLSWLLKARKYYRTLIKTNRYDLVHAFFGFPSGWLCYKSASEIPYIISLRGSDVPGYNVRLGLDYKLLGGLFGRIWRKAAMVVANSRGLCDLAHQFMPELEIQVIPNGIDTSVFGFRGDHELSEPIQVLSVGRLIRRKRIDLMIEAAALAKKEGLHIQLNIAGEGNLGEALQEQARHLDVDQEVRFLGRIDPAEMPEIYHRNDIFLMTSAHEGMSNAMLEATACGLPIITTRCEGVEEIISDNGIVLESPHAVEIVKAIQTFVVDPERYRRMSQAARKRAEEFSWKATAKQYIDCYNKVNSKGTMLKST
jgi:L-malate glycosyltransferase